MESTSYNLPKLRPVQIESHDSKILLKIMWKEMNGKYASIVEERCSKKMWSQWMESMEV